MQPQPIAFAGPAGHYLSLEVNLSQLKKWLLYVPFLLSFALFAAPATAQDTRNSIATGVWASAVARDGSGNIYVIENPGFGTSAEVLKYTGGKGAPTTIYTADLDDNQGLADDYAFGLAVTSNGDVYLSTAPDDNSGNQNGKIIRLVYNSTNNTYTPITFLTSFANGSTIGRFTSLAVDANDNLFAIQYDSTLNSGDPDLGLFEVAEYAASGGVPQAGSSVNLYGHLYQKASTNFDGPSHNYTIPVGLTVDASGNVYAADAFDLDVPGADGGQVIKLTKSSGYSESQFTSGQYTTALGSDAFGNIYATTSTYTSNGTYIPFSLVEYAGGSTSSPVTLYTGLGGGDSDFFPFGIAALSPTDIFVADGFETLDSTPQHNPIKGNLAEIIGAPAPVVSSITATGASPTNATSIGYTVTFSEGVTGVDNTDFTATVSGVTTTGITVTPVSSSVYTVTVNGVSGNGTLRLDLDSSGTGIADLVGNAISGGFTGGDTYTIDQTAPTVGSITATGASPTNATSVGYTVTFSEGVTGVDNTDFTATVSGVTTTGITVTPVSSSVYTVTVNGVSGNGTVRLDLNSSGTGIADLVGNAITGGFTGGDTYTIDQTAPTVVSIAAADPIQTNETSLDYQATFSEPVTGVDASDFTATTSGVSAGAISVSPVSSTVYNITVNTVSGNGTLRLDLNSSGTGIADLVGNAISGGFTGGDTYNVDQTLPTASISAPSVTQVGNSGSGSVTYTVTYADANFNTSSLTGAGITLNTTGTATGTVGVSGSGTSYTVTISGITGLGTIGISVAGGSANDLAGNTDLGAGPSATFTVLSSNAALSLIALNPYSTLTNTGTVGSTTTYTTSVSNATTSVTITPTTADATATVKVNGVIVISGTASIGQPLNVGANTIPIVVTAQDGTTIKTYSIVVTRASSSNASLSVIALTPYSSLVNAGTVGTTTTYTTSVSNATVSVKVTPTTSDPNATIKVNGIAVTSGTASGSIALGAEGSVTTINTVVTAQDGTTTKTYAIAVTRAPSANASLSVISLTPYLSLVNTGTVGTTTTYTTSVVNATASVKVTPTTSDPNATVKVNGVAVTSGTASGSIALAEGATTTINTVVTAQDGTTTRTYSIVVTRAPSSNASLSIISLTPYSTLTNTGTVGTTTTYTTSVVNATASVKVTPTTGDANATVKVNGVAVTSGTASASIALAEGANTTITTIVTAQDGTTTRTYSIVVTRAPSSNASLTTIALTPYSTLTNTGTTGTTTTYTTSVSNATASVKVTPTTSDANAKVKVNGAAVTSGIASGSIALAVGQTTITTVVTAQDGSTTRTYSIVVTRATGPLMSLYQPVQPEVSVTKPTDNVPIENDGIMVHQGVSPNGDGLNDYLRIDGLLAYPDNQVTIIDRSGAVIFEAKGYNNIAKVFDGHSSINGRMLQSGTYYYSLDYVADGQSKHKTGFILLKY